MSQAIIAEVTTLFKELTDRLPKFKTSVQYLEEAEQKSKAAVSALEGSEAVFSEKSQTLSTVYDNLAKLLNQSESLHAQLQSYNPKQEFDRLDEDINKLAVNIASSTEGIKEVQSKIEAIASINLQSKLELLKVGLDKADKSSQEIAHKTTEWRIPTRFEEIQGAVEKGFADTSKGLTPLQQKVDHIDQQTIKLTALMDQVSQRMDALKSEMSVRLLDNEKRIEQVLQQTNQQLITKMDALESSQQQGAKQVQTLQKIVIGLVIAVIVLVIISLALKAKS